MATHFILEIDEDSLSLVLVEVHRKRVQVLQQRRVALPSMEGSALVFALHDALKDLDKCGAQVHVILSDPNFLHFDLQAPKLEYADLEMIMRREARRLGSIPEEEEVLLGHSSCKKATKGTRRYAVVALPGKSVQPIQEALAREGLCIDSLTSVEEAAVRLLQGSVPEACLYLDHGAGRIRFVYVEDGVITQRRHILAPGMQQEGSESDGGFWVEQLSMEIGWNLDYLGDMGKTRPEGVVLSMDFDLSGDQIDKIRGELPVLPTTPQVFAGPEGGLSQAIQGILQSLASGTGLSILGKRAKQGKFDRKLVLCTMLSAALTTAALAGTGWVLKRDTEVREKITAGDTRLQELRVQGQGIAENLDGIELREERARLRSVLASRRPISLLLGECCGKVPTGITLLELRSDPEGGLRLRGRAGGRDRLDSLELVKAYRVSLQELGFLQEVRERIERFEGDEAWLDFLMTARWKEGG